LVIIRKYFRLNDCILVQPYEELMGNFSNGSGLVHLLGSRPAGLKPNMLPSQITSLIFGGVGILANGAILALLVRARNMFGSTNVSYLIANQSAMDLCSCFFLVLTVVLKMTKAYVYVRCISFKFIFASVQFQFVNFSSKLMSCKFVNYVNLVHFLRRV